MSPKLTEAMMTAAIEDGAEVKTKRKVSRPAAVPPPEHPPAPSAPDRGPEIEALRAEISQLKAELAEERKAALRASQDVTRAIETLSESKPLRLKPIRDMNRESPTYLLVEYYDFVPVTYQPRKLNS